VLTKPDTVDKADSEIWENIMRAKSHKLYHGYYMTRLPKSDEMAWTPEFARIKEMNFLTGHEVWSKLTKDRLGSANLAKALSQRLSQMIQDMSISPRT
jgi:16S rRNA G1207 methylase RsmC